MKLYHYSVDKHPVLKTKRAQGIVSDDKYQLSVARSKIGQYLGSYYDCIFFFVERLPLDSIAAIFDHKHEFWKDGKLFYEHVIETSDLPDDIPFEMLELPYELTIWDEVVGSREVTDVLWAKYHKARAVRADKEGDRGVTKRGLELCCQRYLGGTKDAYLAAAKSTDPEKYHRYAQGVPHVGLYPLGGTVRVESTTLVRIGDNSCQTPSALWHASIHENDTLKPGYWHTGVVTRWDSTESNKYLYSSSDRLEAIVNAVFSTMEADENLGKNILRYKYTNGTIEVIPKPGKSVAGYDISRLLRETEIYVYKIQSEDEHWEKVDSKVNGSTTEYRTASRVVKFAARLQVPADRLLAENNLRVIVGRSTSNSFLL